MTRRYPKAPVVKLTPHGSFTLSHWAAHFKLPNVERELMHDGRTRIRALRRVVKTWRRYVDEQVGAVARAL